MKKILSSLALCTLAGLPLTASADLTSTVTALSDYSFNGVSQTDEGPSLQASLDYGIDSGWYLGGFASNVDFGGADDTWLELDVYGGKYTQLTERLGLDTGIAYYSYHGDDGSDDYQYPEVYAKLGYDSAAGHSELNFWYSWDYFGVDAGHYIAMLAHTFSVAQGHDIRVSVDRSTSKDTGKWAWDGGDAYNHVRIAYMTHFKGFDMSLAAEDTSMDTDSSDARLVFSIGRTFNL
jgi:uncharacterized protein (TIGR02001 family)